jgi:hypothetical protein
MLEQARDGESQRPAGIAPAGFDGIHSLARHFEPRRQLGLLTSLAPPASTTGTDRIPLRIRISGFSRYAILIARWFDSLA